MQGSTRPYIHYLNMDFLSLRPARRDVPRSTMLAVIVIGDSKCALTIKVVDK